MDDSHPIQFPVKFCDYFVIKATSHSSTLHRLGTFYIYLRFIALFIKTIRWFTVLLWAWKYCQSSLGSCIRGYLGLC